MFSFLLLKKTVLLMFRVCLDQRALRVTQDYMVAMEQMDVMEFPDHLDTLEKGGQKDLVKQQHITL